MRSETLARALEATGGVNALARALGIDGVVVARWQDIPPRRLAEVARLTGLTPAPSDLAETPAAHAAEVRRWAEENRAAIEAWNRYFEENDTPLAGHRMF